MRKVNIYSLLIISLIFLGCNTGGKTKGIVIDSNSVNEDSIKIANIAKVYENRYEIIGTDHNNAVENYYILIKDIPIDKDTLQDFAVTFRIVHGTNKSNINMIDSKEIYPSIKKYPLKGKEYIQVADHFVAISDFSGYTNMYPLQDIYYKEQGGKNWKIKNIP